MAKYRVVVTGRGIVSPLGIDVKAHRENLFAGESVLGKGKRLSSLGFYSTYGGEVSEAELKIASGVVPPKQRKFMNRSAIMAAVASSHAAEEAGLKGAGISPERLGIFLGTWFTFDPDLPFFIRYVQNSESTTRPHEMDSEIANLSCLKTMNPVDYSIKVLPNLTAAHLAILHDVQGASRVIADGWRGGLLAIAQAAHAIGNGELDIALAGGSESPLEGGIFCELSVLGNMVHDGNDLEGVCCPFDSRRRGIVLGEGAGVVVLEEREHALARQAKVYGEITGSGSSAPSPVRSEDALALSMRNALGESGVEPEEIDFIHANGDSTPTNDHAECRAVKDIFGPSGRTVPVTATKSLHGHLLSGAGGVELVSSLMMLEQGMIAPIANCKNPDPECELDLVRDSHREKPGMEMALINAFGLFGEGASLVVRR